MTKDIEIDQLIGIDIKFFKQKTKTDCAPTALANYWKYLGLNIASNDIKILGKFLNLNHRIGTNLYYIERICGTQFRHITWQRFKIHMLKGYPSFFSTYDHVWFAPYMTKKQATVSVNYKDGSLVQLIFKHEMQKLLKISQVLLL